MKFPRSIPLGLGLNPPQWCSGLSHSPVLRKAVESVALVEAGTLMEDHHITCEMNTDRERFCVRLGLPMSTSLLPLPTSHSISVGQNCKQLLKSYMSSGISDPLEQDI